MFTLGKKFWADELGAGLSSEMALVTGVTVGTLVLSTSSFTNVVQQQLNKAVVATEEPEAVSVKSLTAEEKARDEERRKRDAEKRKQFREARDRANARSD